jgi:hypothetical protein
MLKDCMGLNSEDFKKIALVRIDFLNCTLIISRDNVSRLHNLIGRFTLNDRKVTDEDCLEISELISGFEQLSFHDAKEMVSDFNKEFFRFAFANKAVCFSMDFDMGLGFMEGAKNAKKGIEIPFIAKMLGKKRRIDEFLRNVYERRGFGEDYLTETEIYDMFK